MSKRRRPTIQDLRDLGWNRTDLFQERATMFSAPAGSPVVTPKERAKAQAEQTFQGDGLPPLTIPDATQGLGTSIGMAGSMPFAAALLPEERAQAQQIVQDPQRYAQDRLAAADDEGNWITQGKNMLSSLFDLDDEKETLVESVWDTALSNFLWTYDRIGQAGSYSYAKAEQFNPVRLAGLVTGDGLLDAGVPELSWEEAGKVSFGQVATTAGGQLATQIGGDQGFVGGLMGPQGRQGFDLLNEEQRYKAFQEDLYGKWTSGVTDAVFTVFTDPLIYSGWGLKLARLRYVDRPVRSQAQIDDFAKTITKEVNEMGSGVAPKTSQGNFIKWVTDIDERTGEKIVKSTEIYEHPAIRWSGNRDALTYAFSAAQSPQDAALVMRAAYGDIVARKELLTARADLAFEIGHAEKNLVANKIAFNPDSANKQKRIYDKIVSEKESAYKAAQAEVKAGRMAAEQADEIFVEYKRALEIKKSIDDIDMRSVRKNPVTEDELIATKNDWQKMVERDEWLRRALDESLDSSLQSANKTFSSANPFGRAIERSREARATRSAQTKEVNIAPFKKDTYYGVGRLNRTVNLWRWAWAEKPAGYFATRGVAASEQGREMFATLNQVPIYNGRGIEKVIDGELITVGGVGRKQELFDQYLRATGSGVKDENRLAMTLDAIEQQMMNDVGAFYGLPKAEVDFVYKMATTERANLVKSIKDRKFFIEEVPTATGGKKIVYHTSPYLESQLQNGTYFLDFTVFSRLAKQRANQIRKGDTPLTEQGLSQIDFDNVKTAAAAGRNYASQKALSVYQTFNDVWRPATLLRLGYTQRNLAEGLFRSTAFTGSLMPLGGATMQAAYAVRNAAVKRAVNRDLKKIDKEYTGTAFTTNRFKNWRAKQEEALDLEILGSSKNITDTKAQLKALNVKNDLTREVEENLIIMQAQLDDLKKFRDMLIADDDMALAYYRKQGAAKRRMYDGTSVVDGIEVRGAFANPEYAPVALSNLSADPTVKMMLSLRDRNATNLFKAVETKYFTDVRPGDGPAYWDGLSDMLRQFRSSEVGRKVINGEAPDDIARWLMTDKVGKEIAEFVTGNVQSFTTQTAKKAGKKTVGKGGFNTADYDGALGYVETLYSRLEQLAPSPQLRQMLRNSDVDSKDIKRMLDTDEFRGSLQPAVGDIARETGIKEWRETWRGAVNKAFEWAGTMPEDTFVRTPFYGMRYAEIRDTMLRNLSDYYGNLAKEQGLKPNNMFVPLSEINRAHRIAHRRALKDTKDWLYTIERRTNLGHYGEYIYPFTTSAQNSVTAVGRMVWRNPALPEYLRLAWAAPQEMGIEDDKGNLVFGLPLNFVPDGVKDALGLDNILNVKINKMGLNVFFPETGFGVIPRFGPIVGIPVGEFMKNGFFGLAPAAYTPEWLKVIGEDNANVIWNTWREYVFGEDRAPSRELFSWDQALPPLYNRGIQLALGLNSRTYASTYVKIEQSELLKAASNLREDPPTSEELRTKTNWHFAMRALGNALAFTPPQYQFLAEPLVEARRMYDRNIPEDADKAFYEQFGGLATLISDVALSKNVAGVDPTSVAVERANKYPGLVKEITSNVNDLNVLGIVLNGDPNDEYNPAAVSWQAVSRIPGTSREYRETLDPVEAKNEATRRLGWIKYLQFVEAQDAILQQRGLKSYRDKRAQDLVENRRRFIANAQNNPLYNSWYRDYVDFGSTRTLSAVTALSIALNDQNYMSQEGNSTLEAARLYINMRNEVIRRVKASGKQSLRTKANADLAEQWDRFRSDLINRYSKWGIVSNRYLSGDDDPTAPGIQWWQVADTYDQGQPSGIESSTMDNTGGYLTSGNPEEQYG